MSDEKKASQVILAEFADPAALLKAAEKLRDAGYKNFDCHSPFPIHGMDQAMGLRRTRLGWIIGTMGILGALGGVALQWWTNAYDYPLVISGKPLFSFQAYLPVTFGLGVLLGALTAVFGMFHFNQLPQLFHPMFSSDRFAKVTNDGFFVSVEARDPKFDATQTQSFLQSLGAHYVELVSAD